MNEVLDADGQTIGVGSQSPVIAVTGLAFEASIVGNGATIVCGADPRRIIAGLKAGHAGGGLGILSFGVAGGLAPELEPGQWVIPRGVVTQSGRIETDRSWSERLLRAAPDACTGDIIGVDEPVATEAAKRALHGDSGAHAVDMESHIAAAFARRHGLPFAALRIVVDPANRALPPAACLPIRPDGRLDLWAVLRSLAQTPGQIPHLMRLARDARKAHAALLHSRRLLGPAFAFPHLSSAYGGCRANLNPSPVPAS